MRCANCDRPITRDHYYCPGCGGSLNRASMPSRLTVVFFWVLAVYVGFFAFALFAIGFVALFAIIIDAFKITAKAAPAVCGVFSAVLSGFCAWKSVSLLFRNRLFPRIPVYRKETPKTVPVPHPAPKPVPAPIPEPTPTPAPEPAKDYTRIVADLTRAGLADEDRALLAPSTLEFQSLWDSAVSLLDKAAGYADCVEPITVELAQAELAAMERNYQWKLRNAIERDLQGIRYDIRHDHRNNKLGRTRPLLSFFTDHWEEFDEETKQFARHTAESISYTIDLPVTVAGIRVEPTDFRAELPPILSTPTIAQVPTSDDVKQQLELIDQMEGIRFEYWTADLLSRHGFANVSVTPASGDQGADVLAQKDGILYCIQCKRYNSPLGNSPIQEVHSSLNFYHRQIGAVITNHYFTTGAIRLAKETGTLLWDRDWIRKMLESECADTPTST